jgi:hypothetical protein
VIVATLSTGFLSAMAEEVNLQVYMEGLSRVDRVVDDSGFAFTALDVIVRTELAGSWRSDLW